MSGDYFLGSATAQPSTRWLDAFPDGICCGAPELAGRVREGDVLWVAKAHARWEALVATLARDFPASPVVVLSLVPDGDEAARALDAGARGYCHGLSVPTLLREVALVVRHGGLWIGPELMGRVIGAAKRSLPAAAPDAVPSVLSPREAEVAREVAAGLSNKEIAHELGIAERTVKAHLSAIFEKLGVRDRVQLVLRLAGRAAVPRGAG